MIETMRWLNQRLPSPVEKKKKRNPEAVAGAAISTGSYAGPVLEHFDGFGDWNASPIRMSLQDALVVLTEVVLQRGQLLPWVCEQL